jgi:hypothetical protein
MLLMRKTRTSRMRANACVASAYATECGNPALGRLLRTPNLRKWKLPIVFGGTFFQRTM